ncbi:TPA: hypothetical protein L5632_001348 [Pseudomonas aeruginosa]|nr:hypothetical protein [Pseudomonas aeruginosa]
MAKVGISHCFDMDRLGHAGVKVKWEPVEARHGVNAQADARRAYPFPELRASRRSAPATPIIQSPA